MNDTPQWWFKLNLEGAAGRYDWMVILTTSEAFCDEKVYAYRFVVVFVRFQRKRATFGMVSSGCFVVSQNVGIICLQFPKRMTFNFTTALFSTSVCCTTDEAMAQMSCCNKRLRYGWPGHDAIVKVGPPFSLVRWRPLRWIVRHNDDLNWI